MSRTLTRVHPRRFFQPRMLWSSSAASHTPAFRAWWTRLLASMPRRTRHAPAPELTLVLWTSSVEGIATSERPTLH